MNACTALISMSFVLLLAACSKSEGEWIKEGNASISKGDLGAGVIAFKNAVQLAPESASARTALAESLERAGDLVGAEEHFRRALDLGGSADALAPRIAILMLDQNQPAKLLRTFSNTALQSAPADSDLRALLSIASLSERQQPEAKAFVAGAKASTPALRFAKIQLDLADGHREDALKAADALLAEKDVPWFVLRGLSRVYSATGDQKKSQDSLRLALAAAPEHAGLQGELAETLLASGKIDEAKKLRDKLMKSAPRHYRSMFVDAFLKLQDGKPDEAHAQASRVLTVLPEHAPSLMIVAGVELERGEYASAEARARKIVQGPAAPLDAYRLLTRALLAQRKFAEAGEAIARGLALAPTDRALLVMSAEVQWGNGKKAEAIETLQKAIASSKDNTAGILVRQAEMQFAQGQNKIALESLAEAEKQAGQNAQLSERMFQVALGANQLDHARRMADEAVRARPTDPAPLMWHAAIAGSEKKQDAAADLARKALDLKADYYPALLALRSMANTAERRTEVQSRLDKAIASGTKDARIFLDTAVLLRTANASPDAISAVFDKGIAAQPGAVSLREATTGFWLDQGKKDKALSVAQGGLAAKPDSPEMGMLVASVLQASGDNIQAATQFGQLATRYPDKAVLRIRQAEALQRAGQVPQAIEVLQKAVTALPNELSVHTQLAVLQMQQGSVDAALVTASILRDRKVWAAQGWLLQGDIQAETKRTAEAFKSYAAAADAGAPGRALQQRIRLLDRTNDSPRAERELQAWLSTHADDGSMIIFASQRAAAAGDHKAASAFLTKLKTLHADDPVVLNDLAWEQLLANDPAALQNAQRANEVAPDNSNILDTLGLAQLKAGQRKEAEASLRKALAISPTNYPAKIHLAEIVLADNDKSAAKKLVESIDEKSVAGDALKRLQAIKAKVN